MTNAVRSVVRVVAVLSALCSGVASPGCANLQEPAAAAPAPAAVAAVRELAERSDRRGCDREQLARELGAAVERDYAAAFAAWQALPEGTPRTWLENALALPAVRAAATVFAGSVARIEAVQGGVVDYHHLDVHLDGVEVVRADPATRGELAAGYVAMLRGTSRDTWLAAQLRLGLECVVGPRVWLLTPVELIRAPAGDEREPRGVVVQEWRTLPAAALPCLRRLLRGPR